MLVLAGWSCYAMLCLIVGTTTHFSEELWRAVLNKSGRRVAWCGCFPMPQWGLFGMAYIWNGGGRCGGLCVVICHVRRGGVWVCGVGRAAAHTRRCMQPLLAAVFPCTPCTRPLRSTHTYATPVVLCHKCVCVLRCTLPTNGSRADPLSPAPTTLRATTALA